MKSITNPPTLWVGVIDLFEAKGGGVLPLTPLRPVRPGEGTSKIQPVRVKRSKRRPVWAKRNVKQQKSCGWVVYGTLA